MPDPRRNRRVGQGSQVKGEKIDDLIWPFHGGTRWAVSPLTDRWVKSVSRLVCREITADKNHKPHDWFKRMCGRTG